MMKLSEVFDNLDQKYRIRYRQSDIILLNFENGIMFDKDKINEEKRRMRAYLRDNGKKQLYMEMIDKVSKSPIYIRGHNVFSFIQKYLLYYHNISFNDKSEYLDYKRIVGQLKIEMEMCNN